MEELLRAEYVIQIDSGLVVITHWLLHNHIRKDRYKPTAYVEEFRVIEVDDNGVYYKNGE